MDKKYDVFISHSNKDKAVADAICHVLEQYGIPCWIAPRDVRPGERYALEIIHGIKSCRLMVLVYTRSSNESQHVANEVDRAFNEGKTIIPFLVDETPMNEEFSYYLARKHWLVAYPHYTEKLEDLAQIVASTLGVELKSITKSRDGAHMKQQEKSSGNVQVHIEVDADCELFSFSSFVQSLKAGEDNVVRMKPGKYKLEFVSAEFPDVKISKVYALASDMECDFMEVTLKEEVEARRKLEDLKLHRVEQNGKYGFADENGNIVIPCIWEEVLDFSEGMASVKDANGKCGFIDKTGTLVIPCKWDEAFKFHEGLAAIMDTDVMFGFIDKTGAIVIPCKWEAAIYFAEGLAAVMDANWMWGYIDKTGKLVIPCKWKGAGNFNKGKACVEDVNRNQFYIDKTGKVVK